jgi:hypothetical protein
VRVQLRLGLDSNARESNKVRAKVKRRLLNAGILKVPGRTAHFEGVAALGEAIFAVASALDVLASNEQSAEDKEARGEPFANLDHIWLYIGKES